MMLLLASASPRRRELLDRIGVGHSVLPMDLDETPRAGEAPADFALRMALEKARAGLERSDRTLPVLGADTVVVIDGKILGKPRDRAHALEMLGQLSGREHRVLTAVALVREGCEAVRLSESTVRFRLFGPEEAEAYWETGEPRDKAGAYGIQGLGELLVEHLSGSHSGVMGLPLFETGELLREFGIIR